MFEVLNVQMLRNIASAAAAGAAGVPWGAAALQQAQTFAVEAAVYVMTLDFPFS